MGLLVKLAHKGVDEFASKYATNLSDGGMFIRTREPKARGTELSFKVEIADGQRKMVPYLKAFYFGNGHPGREVGQDIVHGDAHAANARATATLARLDGDPRSPLFIHLSPPVVQDLTIANDQTWAQSPKLLA